MLQTGETLQHQLTSTAAVKHAITALWNANDFGSGLYTGSVGIATWISSRLQLSVDLLDTFKTRPVTVDPTETTSTWLSPSRRSIEPRD